jgi:hypothetical protein
MAAERRGGHGSSGQPPAVLGWLTRLAHAWRELAREQRVTALAALALWFTMFLPWYSRTAFVTVDKTTRPAAYSVSAFGAFSFVEAAVLLVSVAVLGLLFARAEGRAFHLPGGDGAVIAAAGIWVALLIFYRMLDKPGTQSIASVTTTWGVQWGIFIALLAAVCLAYQGLRIRASNVREPALYEDPTVAWTVVERPGAASTVAAAHARELRAARAARQRSRDAEGT